MTDHLLRPPPVIDRVVGLHAPDYPQLCDPGNVRRRDMLEVFDAKAAIARSVFARDAGEDVELGANRAIANRVHDDVQPGFVGAGRPRIEMLRRVDEEARVVRCIREWGEHRRGVGAERTVHETFEAANVQPRIAAAARPHGVAQLFPRREWHGRVDARAHPAAVSRALESSHVGPCAHVVDGGHAVARDVRHRGIDGPVDLLRCRLRNSAIDE